LTNKSYFISSDEERIYVIDENSNRIIKSLDAPSVYDGIDINTEMGLIYVGIGLTGDGLYVINGTTDIIIDTIELDWLHDFEINPLNNMLYALTMVPDGSLVFYEYNLTAKKIVRSIPVDDSSYFVEISPYKELIYIGNGNKSQVGIINASFSSQNLESIGNVSVANSPSDMIINPITDKIYLINYAKNRISIIDTNRNNSAETIILNSSELSEEPSITVDPKNNFIYISSPQEGRVFVIDENSKKVLASLEAGVYPTNLIYSPFGSKLYVTSLTDPVSLLNVSKDFVYTKYLDYTTKDSPGISVRGSPSSIVLNPIANRLYVSYHNLKEISIINTIIDQIVDTIPLDFVPQFTGINPETNILYIASNDTLFAVDTLNNQLQKDNLSIHQGINNIAKIICQFIRVLII
jgi:DNA-binding beta-propeller fold protein YncE